MNWAVWFWIETWGSFTESVAINLGPNANGYLGEAYISLKDGGDYAHVYVSEVCTGGGDVVLCGERDEPGGRSVVILPNNTLSVTYALHTTGGHHVAEGVIYSL